MANKYLDKNGLIYVWSKIKTLLAGKVDVVSGKGLSTNDYTTSEKTKLAGIEAQANKYVLPKSTTSSLGGVIVGDNLSIDSNGRLSAMQGSYTLPTASAAVKGGVKIGSNLTMNGEVLSATYSGATSSADGLMSSADKSKLDGIATGANKTVVDTALSGSSDNPVQNKAISTALAGKVDAVSGKGLSTNDYTTSEKTKLAGIETNANHYVLPTAGSALGGVKTTSSVSDVSTYTACPIANGVPYYKDTNTTYGVATTSANGLMSSSDKSKLDGFGAASTYALKSDISNVYKYKGSVAAYEDLPTAGLTAGDVYNVEIDGQNYAWTGTEWDSLGEVFQVDPITNSEIDQIFAA